jgi:hypothetical protein
MIIRQEQTNSLAQAAEAGYVENAVAHLERYDPPMAAAAGRPGLERLARDGLTAARSHGFTEDRTLQLYLELLVSLGSGFDTDPQFRWLQPFLEPLDSISTVERARLLHFHATAYLDRAYGAQREHGRAVIARAAAIRLESLKHIGSDIDAAAKRLVDWLHPQRADFVDADALRDLAAGAREEAGRARLPMAEGAALLFLLKFTFGHNVCSDPLYPWLERQLASPDPPDESTRMERLAVRTQTYLTMMQRNVGEAGG